MSPILVEREETKAFYVDTIWGVDKGILLEQWSIVCHNNNNKDVVLKPYYLVQDKDWRCWQLPVRVYPPWLFLTLTYISGFISDQGQVD